MARTPEGRERQLEALRQFQWPKGRSGHPGGRPAKRPITEEFEKAARTKLPPELRRFKFGKSEIELRPDATMATLLAFGIFAAGIKGDASAGNLITERVEGKLRVPIDVSGLNFVSALNVEELEWYAVHGSLPENTHLELEAGEVEGEQPQPRRKRRSRRHSAFLGQRLGQRQLP